MCSGSPKTPQRLYARHSSPLFLPDNTWVVSAACHNVHPSSLGVWVELPYALSSWMRRFPSSTRRYAGLAGTWVVVRGCRAWRNAPSVAFLVVSISMACFVGIVMGQSRHGVNPAAYRTASVSSTFIPVAGKAMVIPWICFSYRPTGLGRHGLAGRLQLYQCVHTPSKVLGCLFMEGITRPWANRWSAGLGSLRSMMG